MPYVSSEQRAWAHTKAGMKALGKKKVKEYDEKSRGMELPEKAKKKKKKR